MTNVILTQSVMQKLGIEFVELDFTQPTPVIPQEHLDWVVPDSWEDVKMYEGQLAEELNYDSAPGVTRFEQDCWDNAIDLDDLQSGPDPYHLSDPERYEDVIEHALKSHSLLYG